MCLSEIVKNFRVGGEVLSVEPYGNGHINTTYVAIVKVDGVNSRFIVQKINANVFPRVGELMDNISNVTRYMANVVDERGGDSSREVMTVVPTLDGKTFFVDEKGDNYRVYIFIEQTMALQIVEDPSVYEGAGRAFGEFVSMLNSYPASSLYEAIYNFHNTAIRFQTFTNALDADKVGRKDSVLDEIDFVLRRSGICDRVVTMLEEKPPPHRVTHNDSNLNNVLLDDKTGAPVCVIDLDTIMPGSLLYDFGDAIRSGCNTGLEDEPDLSKVAFDINLYEYFTRGYLSGIGNNITAVERDMLSFGSILMTFECGMRFLTDYLDGDNYFKTHYDTHNLDRCRTQFKMVADMENVQNEMDEIARRYCKL